MSLPQGILPVLALKNTLIFPGLTQVIKVGRDKSIKALQHAEKHGFWIATVQQKTKDETKEVAIDPNDLYSVGTLCRIDSMKGNPQNGYQVVLRGFARIRLGDIRVNNALSFLEADTTILEDVIDINEPTRLALLESLKSLSREILRLIPANTDQLTELVASVDDLPYLTSLCIGNLDVDLAEKQRVLEMTNLKERVLHILTLMNAFKEGLVVQAEIRGKLHQKLGETQRQAILREQLRAIREELGETEGPESQEDKLRAQIEQAGMPEDVRKMAEQELRRLTEVGNQSPESHIIRNYLELLTSLPWGKSSPENEIDLDRAREILNRDHYGLGKVKQRIVQHLAVMKLKKETKGSILLFVGPPGVGKTSLGQSIGEALGRKFVRVSFGGVRDDAEVRGHRRTYIGAMPGRIIQGLKRAGENNPVFLLDEIDKLSRSYNGDPASALLEVLDPEQNGKFLDHYLDVPFDLSKVFFVLTANTLEGIPGPLLDRMEVIELTGYTTAEKLHIAKNHLVPKVLKEYGIATNQLEFPDETLLRMISTYTREAGVRELQRKIAALARGFSERIVNATQFPLRVSLLDLDEILGQERYVHEVAEALSPPGVATGLAWTPVGGDILYIEAKAMPGHGKLTITGQLGDVMKESTRIALSILRSHSQELESSLDLSKFDFHVHVPAGGIPKDGPSAGVTLLTALFSLVSQKPVKTKTAMTGEITLRGAVMPVGGIKEKLIAAHRAGIETVIIPKRNEKDLRDVPDEVKSQLKIVLAETIQEVLKEALALDLKLEQQNLSLLLKRDSQVHLGQRTHFN